MFVMSIAEDSLGSLSGLGGGTLVRLPRRSEVDSYTLRLEKAEVLSVTLTKESYSGIGQEAQESSLLQ